MCKIRLISLDDNFPEQYEYNSYTECVNALKFFKEDFCSEDYAIVGDRVIKRISYNVQFKLDDMTVITEYKCTDISCLNSVLKEKNGEKNK